MKDLWHWQGEIARGSFLLWASILFICKYNLDRLVVHSVFHRSWSVFSYLNQPFPGFKELIPAQDADELMILLASALPFLWLGVLLCIKRLRSARLPLWLAVLFVVPIVKWFLFILLASVPERGEPEYRMHPVAAWLPKTVWGSAALAVAASVLLATGAAILSATMLREYSWGLFVGVPFSMGFISALIHGARQKRRLSESLAVASASVLLTGVVFLAIAFEGAVCLIMAAPLATVLSFIGALAGHIIQSSYPRRIPSQLFCVPVLALPLMLGTEWIRPEPPPLLKVVTAIEVNAPVETVWKYVVKFSELPPPKELIFKLGIAYPIRAEIQGQGVGAVRHCIFSTGPFVEPITVWDEPRLLKFSVSSNPAPLQEWTPYREIHPPHLNGFLVSEQGQFQLTELPGDRTRLEGTTWYHHTMWPVNYWQIWSDRIIHTIHQRVLEQVKNLAEQDAAKSRRTENTAASLENSNTSKKNAPP